MAEYPTLYGFYDSYGKWQDTSFLYGPVIIDTNRFDLNLTGGNKNMAKTVSASEIGVGDVINVIHEGQEVSKVSTEKGETLITTREGKTVWPTTNGNAPTRFELVKKAKVKPENWPPKRDDVWEASYDGYGTKYRYHCDSNGKLRYGSMGTTNSPEEVLESYANLKLVFRVGVKL